MKINFHDGSYLEMSLQANEIFITLSARDPKNPKTHIVNSGRVSFQQFKDTSLALIKEYESSPAD